MHKALTMTTFKIHITAELAMLNLQSSSGRRRYFGCRAIQMSYSKILVSQISLSTIQVSQPSLIYYQVASDEVFRMLR